ncbi:MAG: hypothetical protein R8G01_12095 [Ilumatobacteraceae bacterium]|nr:hypothetical protein [Ilumatobacteraceae bacterium]
MSSERPVSTEDAADTVTFRTRVVASLPWMWLGLSAAWAIVIFATDEVAWPLALWIATTVGPLTALKTRLDPNTDSRRSKR